MTSSRRTSHHDLKVANCVFVDGDVSGLFDLGEGTTGDPLEDLARPTWDLAHQDPKLVVKFLGAYEEAAGESVPLERLWAYVVLDLIVIWEYGTRPSQAWFSEATFRAWVETFTAPVSQAFKLLDESDS
jgi:aminoglycoside phosphotransferase (APT) family kinase protein